MLSMLADPVVLIPTEATPGDDADFFDPRLPRKIAKDTGVPLVVLPTSVGAEPAIRTYFDLFDRQLALIGQALGGTAR
jgi:hypothetical protein